MYGRSEIDIKFRRDTGQYHYQTAFVDDAGKLQLRKDVYGRDATMLALLRNSRSKDWKAWSHTPAELTAGERQSAAGVTLPATARFLRTFVFFRTFVLRAAVRRADGCAPVPRSNTGNGGCSTADFLPRSRVTRIPS